MEPALPILVVEGLDVQAFSSILSAQSYLESWWIKEERGRVYDAHGCRMIATCRGQRVSLSLDHSSPPQEYELAAVLRAHFHAVGRPGVGDDCSLPELVGKLVPR